MLRSGPCRFPCSQQFVHMAVTQACYLSLPPSLRLPCPQQAYLLSGARLLPLTKSADPCLSLKAAGYTLSSILKQAKTHEHQLLHAFRPVQTRNCLSKHSNPCRSSSELQPSNGVLLLLMCLTLSDGSHLLLTKHTSHVIGTSNSVNVSAFSADEKAFPSKKGRPLPVV